MRVARSAGWGYSKLSARGPPPVTSFAALEAPPSPQEGGIKKAPLTLNQLTISHENPLPWRRIFPVEGEGKCAVQHSVSVSQ